MTISYRQIDGYGGVPLTVASTGEPTNPAILLIHGYGQSHLCFNRQLRSELSSRFFMVAFDLRGHGGSGKPWRAEEIGPSEVWAGDVAAVVAAMKLERPTLVAWSYGGCVALDYLRHEGTASALNLVGSVAAMVTSSPLDDDEQRELTRVGAMARSPSPLDNIAASDHTIARYRTAGLSDSECAELRAAELMAPAYARRGLGVRHLDNHDLVERLDLPILLSFGDSDRFVRADQATSLVNALPSASVSVYPDTGHLPFISHTERFNSELAALAGHVDLRPQR